MCETCWVALKRDGVGLGGGLRLTNDLVVTAEHCLRRGLKRPDRKPRRGDTLQLHILKKIIDGEPVEEIFDGTVEEIPGGDIALIRVEHSAPPNLDLPRAEEAKRGDPWHTTYRPNLNDGILTGTVAFASLPKQMADGEIINVIQLLCPEDRRDHHGYSGSPVERAAVGASPHAILGILLEQQPIRPQPRMSTNTLYAVSVREATGRFRMFSDQRILEDLLAGPGRPTQDQDLPTSDERRLLAEVLDGAEKGDVLDPHLIQRIRDLLDQNPTAGPA
ncbi:hypothetical protein [Streptomyces sp. HUAS ZL42]|uniref:hypothetical protein n=1 Tax=Streptomyces sp. HUAS ZL42 TaxID=3231715 RepID=UPI00345F08D6